MITLTAEQAQQIEEALDELRYANNTDIAKTKYYKALATIRAAREQTNTRSGIRSTSEYSEQAEQEPVAYAGMVDGSICDVYTQWPVSHYHEIKPLYAAPVRTKDLTDDEIQKWIDVLMYDPPEWALKRFARAVIALDREKNK